MELYFEDFKVGEELVLSSKTIDLVDVTLFAGVTGDYSPLHTSEEFAKATQFKTRIAHGLIGLTFGMGLLSRSGIIDHTQAYLGVNNWDFLGPILIGDTITAKITVKDKKETKRPESGIVRLVMSIQNQREEVVQKGEHILLIARKLSSEKIGE